MSVFKGLGKIVQAAVDVVMVVPDAAVDMLKQEWHEPGVESRTSRRLKRVGRRVVEGGQEVYKNEELGLPPEELPPELKQMKDKFAD